MCSRSTTPAPIPAPLLPEPTLEPLLSDAEGPSFDSVLPTFPSPREPASVPPLALSQPFFGLSPDPALKEDEDEEGEALECREGAKGCGTLDSRGNLVNPLVRASG